MNRYAPLPNDQEVEVGEIETRRSQILLRMENRNRERVRQKELYQKAALRSSQRLKAARKIQKDKQQRESVRNLKMERMKQQKQNDLGSKIQVILQKKIRWAEKSNAIRVLGGENHPVWKNAVKQQQLLGQQAHKEFSLQRDDKKREDIIAARHAKIQKHQEQARRKKRGEEVHKNYVKACSVLSPALAALDELHGAMYSPKEGLVTLNMDLRRDAKRMKQMRRLRYDSIAFDNNKWWAVALALADVSLISNNKDKMDHAFVNWTKCSGHIFENIPVSRTLAQRLNLLQDTSSDEDTNNNDISGATVVDQLRYEFICQSGGGSDGNESVPSSVVASNQLYLKLCRKVFTSAIKGEKIPPSVERIPKGRGLQYLQRWAKEEKDSKQKLYKKTLSDIKKESTEKWDQWASIKDKLMFSIPSSLGNSMTGPIPFRYIGNGMRPSRDSDGSEAPTQYYLAGERISQPKFNSALLALATGRVAAVGGNNNDPFAITNDDESAKLSTAKLNVWGIRSNDPNQPYKDVKESKLLVQRLKEHQQRQYEESKERASLAQEHFTMFQRHTRTIERARILMQQGNLSEERARDDDAWLAVGRVLYAMGSQLEETFVEWSLLHRSKMNLPGTISIGKGQKTATTTAYLIHHLLPGDRVVIGGGRQLLTVSSTIPIERTTLTFDEPSLRTVRDGTVQRADACDREECRKRWSEMCHPYVVPALSHDHWVRIRRARRFIQGERKRANDMRKSGQHEIADEAEHNASMLLRELKKTVLVDEIAFVSFGKPTIVPLLDHFTAEPVHLVGNGRRQNGNDDDEEIKTSIQATLCVNDVINIDDTKEWWDVLQINAEQATIQIRLSHLVEGSGEGPLRFRTVQKKINDDEDNAQTYEQRLQEIETLKDMVLGTTRWITIQEAQCSSGCFVKRQTVRRREDTTNTTTNSDDDDGFCGEDGDDANEEDDEIIQNTETLYKLFHLPFMTASSALRQLEAWSKDDTKEQQQEEENNRWLEWSTARSWLRHESKSKHAACLDLVRRLNPARANDTIKWSNVGKKLHDLSSSKEKFETGTTSIVDDIIEMYGKKDKKTEPNKNNGEEDSEHDDEEAESKDKENDDPLELFIAWTSMSEKWQRLEELGFDEKELHSLCSNQWNKFEKAKQQSMLNHNKENNGILELPKIRQPPLLTAKKGASFFQLETLKDAVNRTTGYQNTFNDKQHPMITWLGFANEYMASLLEIEDNLRSMLNIDLNIHKKRKERRMVPTIHIVKNDDTSAHLSWWWSKSEPWAPVAGTLYEVHLRELKHDDDDVEDLGKYVRVYSGRGSECKLKQLRANTVYIVRMKAVVSTEDTTTKTSIKWSQTTRFTTLSSAPRGLRVTKQIAAGRRFRAIELEWQPPIQRKREMIEQRRRPPRYEVEMYKNKEWIIVWRGTKTCCEINELKRGSIASFRVCRLNYAGKRSECSTTLKVNVRNAFRNNVWASKKKKGKDEFIVNENAAIENAIVVEDVENDTVVDNTDGDNPVNNETEEEIWKEVYDQRSGGFYWRSNNGKETKELPFTLY
jgi:hypothetical protein